MKVMCICCATETRDEIVSSLTLTHPNLVQTYMAFQRRLPERPPHHEFVNEDGQWTIDPDFEDLQNIDLRMCRKELQAPFPESARRGTGQHGEGLFECYLVQVRSLRYNILSHRTCAFAALWLTVFCLYRSFATKVIYSLSF